MGDTSSNGELPRPPPPRPRFRVCFPQTLTHNLRPYEYSVDESLQSLTAASLTDTQMRDALTPAISDYEYDSHSIPLSQDSDTPDWYYDPLPEDVGEINVETAVDMGEAIAFAFPLAMEYDLHDQRDALDDGLSGDESSSSDASSNYEEATEPEFVVQVIEAEVRGKQEEEEYEESVEDYDWDGRHGPDVGSENEADSDHEIDGDENSNPEEESEGAEAETNMRVEDIYEAESSVPASPIVQRGHQTLVELEQAAILQSEKHQAREKHLWRHNELQECLRQVQRQLLEVETDLEAAEHEIQIEQENQARSLAASSLSSPLFEAYQTFCESLLPEFGSRDGWSITCDQSHNGSYALYDPRFDLFKEFVGMDYSTCNFRCEAKDTDTFFVRGQNRLGGNKIVEFWPIKFPETVSGSDEQWGQVYPELYRLAFEAARNGSEAAVEMIVRLPDMNELVKGWLFDYEFECLLMDEPVVSRRWKFRGAYKIDHPLTPEVKREKIEQRIERMLANGT